MFKQIVNPATGRKVNVNGKLGQKVLSNYYNQIGGDGKWYEIGNPFCGKGCVLFDESANKPVELGNNLKIVSRAKAKQMQLKAHDQSPLPTPPQAPAQAETQAQETERVRAAQVRAQEAQGAQEERLGPQAEARPQAEAGAQAEAQAQARKQVEIDLLEKCKNCAVMNCKRYHKDTKADINGLATLIHNGMHELTGSAQFIGKPTLCGRKLAIFKSEYDKANAGGIIEGFMQLMKNINGGCLIDVNLRRNIIALNSEINTFCEERHPVSQQGGKRKNNSKNNTKKRKLSRKNNRKRRASKNKRN